jgi:glycosyltransferase A (GT-A) superfamily protein (DUF2064 family)
MSNDQPPRRILLVFMRYPEAGRVKTRLAEEIGADAAAMLYRDWIGIVLRNVQALRPDMLIVGYIDGATPAQFGDWSAYVDEWLPQPAGGLGERLAAGFDWGFSRGGPVLAIGTDCLEVDATHVFAALAHLLHPPQPPSPRPSPPEAGREGARMADAVFGPATDGGYYLVGSRRHVAGFFDGIRWSSPHTLPDHLNRCAELGLRVALLPQLSDIDTLADWQAYRRRSGEIA